MSNNEAKLLDYLKRTTADLRETRRTLRELERRSTEPIAIVGMACHYPGGVQSPADLWRLVAEETDAVSGFPSDRGWRSDLYDPEPGVPGKSYAREGGFLHDAPRFDPEFFEISPREATTMDPQQRLLLETSWEALESAGIDPTALKGTATGVFTGLMYHDYPASAGSGSLVSGRISYVLGLEGPSVTVDTACSSSLVALHVAIAALRSGECTLALAGGATVMATPEPFVEFSKQRGLAADGRCKSFSAGADGVGWAEGAGILVVERLSDAHRNGHPVLAVVRGSAVNQDGASNGLTAPNGPSQQRVIRQALANAALTVDDVDAVEAHGTGTTLGDPIEAQAVIATYGQNRAGGPLYLGSLKSNIGHTQAAAGVGGIIKMVMAMRHGRLPKTLHLDEPSPNVDWTAGAVELLAQSRDWPKSDRPRRAAVSSFGISGTNAHVIIEEPEAVEPTERESASPVVWVLSARTAAALRDAAARLKSHVDGTEVPDADVAHTLLHGRARFPHKAVVVGADRAALTAGLTAVAADEPAPNVATGAADDAETSVAPVFLFPGQGSQWAGMAVDLLDTSPVFAARMAECATAIEAHVDWSLLDVVRGAAGAPSLERVDVVQPVLFAVMVSLARLWQASGVEPAAVAGHSQGEIAAAAVTGALSLDDAARVVTLRSKLIASELAGKGGMVSVAASRDEVSARIERWGTRISVAAANGPQSTVVSGEPAALAELVESCTADGVRAKTIAVDYASHSAHVEEIHEQLVAVLAGIEPKTTTVPFYSTLTGGIVDTATLDAEYWYSNLRGLVRYEQVIDAMLADGRAVFAEMSPHPVLTVGTRECVERAGSTAAVLGTLRRDDGGLDRFAVSLAEAYTHGVPVDWTTLVTGGAWTQLPSYPFQHAAYWQHPSVETTDASGLGMRVAGHPLLGATLTVPDTGTAVLTGRLALDRQPWLADHRVLDTIVVPGTALLELAVRAGDDAGCGLVEELTLHAPLVVPDGGGVQVMVTVDAPDEENRRAVAIFGRTDDSDDEEWTRHATGVLADEPTPAEALTEWPPRDAQPVDVADIYAVADRAGLDYGPAFRGLRAVWRSGADLYAEVALPEELEADGFALHPALLDAALHSLAAAAGDDNRPRLPFSWSGVSVRATGATTLRVRLAAAGDDTVALTVADGAGEPVASVAALTLRPLAANQLATGYVDALFRVEWTQLRGGPVTEVPAHTVLPVLPDGATGPAAVRATTTRVLDALRDRLAGSESDAETDPLVVVTSGAVPVGDVPADLAAAAVWGLLRSAQIENPDRIVVVDIDDTEAIEQAVAVALAAGEPAVAVRDGVAHVARLARVGTPEEEARPLDQDGTVLVTGGTGTLGAMIARRLVTEHGVRNLLLTSRRGLAADGAGTLRDELTELGAAVTIAACDAADRDALAATLADIPAAHPLTAVVHTAGVMADGLVTTLTADQLDHVLAPKVDAAWHLHELTADAELAAFVVFSSATGLFGNAGQGGYGAANAYLDALAAHRRRNGLPGQALAWGLWEERSAMTAVVGDTELRRMARSGVAQLSSAQGLSLFDTALALDDALLVPVPLDLAAFGAADAEVPSLLRGLVRTRPRRTAATGSFRQRLAATPEAERDALLLELVRGRVAGVLGHASADQVNVERAFKELGFDSLTSLELRNQLNTATGLRLPATLVFDYPNPIALVAFLRAELSDTAAVATSGTTVAANDDEPIAIVGMACRFPGGVRTPDELWRLLSGGGDAIGAFPGDRGWDLESLFDPDPERAGTSYARDGGFLYDMAEFDPGFFGISPREALAMDPQQRLLLETSWEALERAGIDPATLRGSDTGVFAGVMYYDYAVPLEASVESVEGFVGTGTSGGVVSGRISYLFGFEGPTLTVDTACSSSLVALHLAVQGLRRGECSLALAGGVSVMVQPATFVEFSKQRNLAPDGRVKAFAEAADGTSLSEGVGQLVLERLSDARRNGHPVLAVVRGSAVNSDGASNGLTAPNGPSQQRVIRSALANAGLTPSDVDTVEAHGTGTTLGDPIEAQALLATYGQDRPADRPLWLGSVKSNLGHTQAAAGVAGLMKMVLALRHGELPPTLHVDDPSSHVDWTTGAVRLATETVPLAADGRPLRAAVSSFGISGTNAHVIVEQAPAAPAAPAVPAAPSEQVVPLVLSAKSPAALTGQADRLRAFLADHPDVPLADVAAALATTRSHFAYRGAVVGADAAEVSAALADVSGETTVDGRVAYLCTGQGSQRPGMGKELYDAYPVFRDACDAAFAEFDPELRDVMWGERTDSLDRTEYAQPALFVVETALYRLFESWGVTPAAVAGHSIGEVVAAYLAGVWSLPDACAFVSARGRLMGALPEGGAMAAVAATEDEVTPLLDDTVGIAAVNGPAAVVVSGAADAVDRIVAEFTEQGRRTRKLRVSHAFHSPLMTPMLDDFRAAIADVTFLPATVPVVSTVTGAVLTDDELSSPDHWVRNVAGTVRFADAVAALQEFGARTFVELGPDGVLSGMGQDSARDGDAFVPAQRRDRDEARTLVAALARVHSRGGAVDWSAFFTGAGTVELPTYAFQRERYWPRRAVVAGDATGLGLGRSGHPLLGAAVVLPESDGLLLTGRVAVASHPWLADHAVGGAVLVPGAALVELVAHAANEVGCESVAELTLGAPLVLPERGGVALRVSVGEPDESGGRTVTVHSRLDDEPDWTRNVDATVTPAQTTAPAALTEWPPADAESLDASEIYDRMAGLGLDYGPAFRGVRAAWRRGDEVYAEVALPDPTDAGQFGLHPALLDAALHPIALGGFLEPADQAWLPFGWRGVSVYADGAASVRVRLAPAGNSAVSVTLTDEAGAPVAAVEALTLRPAPTERLGATRTPAHRLAWVAPDSPATQPARVALLGADPFGVAALLGADVRTSENLSDLTEIPDVVVASLATATDPHAAAHEALALAQEWLADERFASARLAVLTRGAVATGDEDVPDLAHATVWGLIRAAQSEAADRFVLVDVSGEPAGDALRTALGLGEPQVALRGNGVLVPRVVRAEESDAVTLTGTVLLTGGTGALGAHVARHLVTAHDVRRLILTSRRGLAADGAAELRDELAGLGADVTVAACDLADRGALAALLKEIGDLDAVVHAAGVLDDGVLASLTPERVDTVLRAKADSALNLHELTEGLTAFVLFSSVSGVFGGPGQGNYAAANAYLDALAAHRRATGLPATSIAWGRWDTGGMTDELTEADLRRMRRSGVGALSTEDGLALFDTALGAADPLVLGVRLELSALRSLAESGVAPPLFAKLVRTTARRKAGAAAPSVDALRDRLAGLAQPAAAEVLLDLVRGEIATVLAHPNPDAVEAGKQFTDLGFDSLTAVELRNRLDAATGLRLPATLVFDHPTVGDLAGYLTGELAGTGDAGPTVLSVFADLDRLETTIPDLTLDQTARARLATKLRDVLGRLDATDGPVATVTDINSATDDEVFALIDDELGIA